jgi:hypothetical protein
MTLCSALSALLVGDKDAKMVDHIVAIVSVRALRKFNVRSQQPALTGKLLSATTALPTALLQLLRPWGYAWCDSPFGVTATRISRF